MKPHSTFLSFPLMAILAASASALLLGNHAFAQADAAKPVLLDRIVLIVNEEAVTRYDINAQKNTILKRMNAANVTPPPDSELEHQITERLITEKALMQFARETGIRTDDTMIDRAISRVAQENHLTLEELRDALAQENIPFPFYREELRKQITLQRLRERDVDRDIVVTDAEVGAYLKLVNAQVGGETEYLISHILVTIPDQATPDLINERQARAEGILKRLR
ncbi:MAG: SurA N-terminal domain-containing protein, partial [Burkholderiales bacterium]|nr:SurA N-terminal domain-containing protein [Burkholderiales bacterium]